MPLSLKRKYARDRDADQSQNSQLLLVLDDEVGNQEEHSEDDQFQLRSGCA
jgi:hypothetical protein